MIEYDTTDYPSYSAIVEAWGYEIVDRATFGSYQGDYVYLLKSGGQYGWIVIGYGSCSGCDHLEALSDYNDRWNDAVLTYAEELRMRVQWFNAKGLVEYLTNEYLQEGQWSWHEDGYRNFVGGVVSGLTSEPSS